MSAKTDFTDRKEFMRTIKLELKVTDETYREVKTFATSCGFKTREEVLVQYPGVLIKLTREHLRLTKGAKYAKH